MVKKLLAVLLAAIIFSHISAIARYEELHPKYSGGPYATGRGTYKGGILPGEELETSSLSEAGEEYRNPSTYQHPLRSSY